MLDYGLLFVALVMARLQLDDAFRPAHDIAERVTDTDMERPYPVGSKCDPANVTPSASPRCCVSSQSFFATLFASSSLVNSITQ
jgi:hypothetical protein